jgi:hypothetical protein
MQHPCSSTTGTRLTWRSSIIDTTASIGAFAGTVTTDADVQISTRHPSASNIAIGILRVYAPSGLVTRPCVTRVTRHAHLQILALDVIVAPPRAAPAVQSS